MSEKILLSNMIKSLRSELQTAMKDGDNEALKFEVGDIELDLQVIASVDGTIEAGVKFYVFSGGAKATGKSQITQNIKLKMKPMITGTSNNGADNQREETAKPLKIGRTVSSDDL